MDIGTLSLLLRRIGLKDMAKNGYSLRQGKCSVPGVFPHGNLSLWSGRGGGADHEDASGGQLAPKMKGQEGTTELWEPRSSFPTHPSGESVYPGGKRKGSGAGDSVFGEVHRDHMMPAREIFSSNTVQSASVPNIIWCYDKYSKSYYIKLGPSWCLLNRWEKEAPRGFDQTFPFCCYFCNRAYWVAFVFLL